MQLPPLRPVYPSHIEPLSPPISPGDRADTHTPSKKQNTVFVERRKHSNRRVKSHNRGAFELRSGRGRRRYERNHQPSISIEV